MRLELDGLVEVGDGAIGVAVVAVDIPSVDVGVGSVRWVYFRPRSEIWQKRTISLLFANGRPDQVAYVESGGQSALDFR
jgi:hypothetical protein